MAIEERVRRYMLKVEGVFRSLKISGEFVVKENFVKEVVDEAKRYFEDAKYYLERKEYEVSLASIAYCEGLLDALRILRIAEFEW
ncbi:MAG: DUF357 domain-containing protein [Candidatus Bathyarchaeota archaeon]|nr:DUF357 domain-containing protein [Candidatus Bathyarchaeota archaeon]